MTGPGPARPTRVLMVRVKTRAGKVVSIDVNRGQRRGDRCAWETIGTSWADMARIADEVEKRLELALSKGGRDGEKG